MKKPGKGPKRHTGRDEVEIRYPVRYCFFWIPDSRCATSGMTDLALVGLSDNLYMAVIGKLRWKKAGVKD